MSCEYWECPLGAVNPTVTVLDAALHYAELGLAVFPLAPFSSVPHGGLGYRDDGHGGVYWATCDGDTVRGWFTEWPTANVGVALGEPSGGVFAVDVDVPWPVAKNDPDTWSVLGELPLDVTASTPSGGRHVLLRTDRRLGNSTKKLARGIDVKADAGYVVGAPSVRRSPDSGELARYRWLAHPDRVPEAPQSLLERIEAADGWSPSENGSKTGRDRFQLLMDHAPSPVNEAGMREHGFSYGSRNSDAHRLACRLWRKYGDERVVFDVLREAWDATSQEPDPFPWREVVKAARSAQRFIERDTYGTPSVTVPSHLKNHITSDGVERLFGGVIN